MTFCVSLTLQKDISITDDPYHYTIRKLVRMPQREKVYFILLKPRPTPAGNMES